MKTQKNRLLPQQIEVPEIYTDVEAALFAYIDFKLSTLLEVGIAWFTDWYKSSNKI